MRTLLSLKMAFDHVRAGFGRMALSVLAIALGVALVVAVRIMNDSVLASFLDTVDEMVGRAALTVTAGEGLTFAEEVAEKVSAVPGVKLAVPLVRSVAFPDDGSGDLLTVHGVDITNEAAVRVYHRSEEPQKVIDDVAVFLMKPDSVLIGREFAAQRRLRVGSPLELVTPRGLQRFTVRGILEPQGVARTLRGRLVVMDLFAAEDAFTAPGQISQIDVLLAEGATVESTKAAVATVLPAGLRVEEPGLRKDVIRKTVGGFQGMMTAFGFLAVLAGFVICYSRLGAIFEARTWEVGLMRAVGLRRAVVFTELLKESLLLGAAGVAVGIPLGAVVGHFGLPFLATATALNFQLPVSAATSELSAEVFVVGAAIGLSAAVLAAVLPALRLARKQPVAALTMRGRAMPAATRRIGAALGLGALAATGGLILWQHMSGISVLGNLTTVLIALAACVLAGPLVSHGSSSLMSTLRHLFGPTGEFAAGHLGEHARPAALTVGTLGVGLGAVLMFGMLGFSFERTLVSQVSSRLHADLIVTSAFVSGGWVNAPLTGGLVDKLKAIPGVAVAAGAQVKNISYADGTATIDAYDPICFRDDRLTQWRLAAGALPEALGSVAQGNAIMVTTSFAHTFNTRPGDTLRLDSPQGPQSLQVAGITSSDPKKAIIMSRTWFRSAWNDSLIMNVHIAVDEGVDPRIVQARIEGSLGEEYSLLVRSSAALIKYFASQARQAFSVFYLMEAITFLLVSMAIGDTLATGVVEHTREFGMLRAVGLRRSHLFGIVMLEGGAIGSLGLLLAAVAGLALGIFWVEVQFPAILGWKLDLHFPYAFALSAAGLTLLLCLAGSALPALRAARLAVPQALRYE
jgi:putative ABC transport system permease protein